MPGFSERVAIEGFSGALESPPAALRRWTRPVAGSSPRLQDLLRRTIEREIVPRLVLAQRGVVAPGDKGLAIPDAQEVAVELANLAMKRDAEMALSFVHALHKRGVPAETLYLDLLAPAARHLGALWEEDLADFTQVTIGVLHLQHVMRDLSPSFHSEAAPRHHRRRVLLTPLPGEQHTFGLSIVAEFFRRAGWETSSGPLVALSDLIAIVRSESFSVVGFSLGCGGEVDTLASCIRAVRRASRNREIGVMVGGPLFTLHPELVAFVGADATSADGRQAPVQAQNLLDLLATRG